METSLMVVLGSIIGFLCGSTLMFVATKGNEKPSMVYGVLSAFLFAVIFYFLKQ